MNKMKKLLARGGVAVVGSLTLVSTSFATLGTDITDAGTAGAINSGLAGSAAIVVVAAIVGIGVVMSVLRKI